jgi:hypothetical protein
MKHSFLIVLIGLFLFSCSPTDTGPADPSPGSTRTARTLPSSAYWCSVTCGNGVLVAVAEGSTPSNTAATSP